jgi:putative two-component system response regulator
MSGDLRPQPRVLLVDDQPENLEVLRDLLEPDGYTLVLARDGQAALDEAFANPPDLVLMDIQMPRLDGLQACRLLKADPRTALVPVVLVTGLGAREDRIAGIAAGCDDFLTKPVDVEQLLARTRTALRTKSLVDDLEQAENVLVSLANALEAKDSYTRGHSDRVATYAERLGRAAGLSDRECRNLHRAGLLHDIGKIGIPLEYLQKPGKLTTEEYEVIKLHPGIGSEICRPLRTMAPLLPLIRGHHERLDGTGYPDRLRGDQIALPVRCLTLADIYDALTSNRAYRRALPPEGALKIMREEAGVGMWDVRLIDLLAGIVDDPRSIQ